MIIYALFALRLGFVNMSAEGAISRGELVSCILVVVFVAIAKHKVSDA